MKFITFLSTPQTLINIKFKFLIRHHMIQISAKYSRKIFNIFALVFAQDSYKAQPDIEINNYFALIRQIQCAL